MPTPMADLSQQLPFASRSDIFLRVRARRAGEIKGEALTQGHVDDIEVLRCAWSAQAGSALGSGAATSRRSYQPLEVFKRIDSASLSLLSAMVTNDELREVNLTVRKAGKAALDYYCMNLAGARLVSISTEIGEHGQTLEKLVFSYTRIAIEYQRQLADGLPGGAVSFSDELLPAA